MNINVGRTGFLRCDLHHTKSLFSDITENLQLQGSIGLSQAPDQHAHNIKCERWRSADKGQKILL